LTAWLDIKWLCKSTE